METKNFNSKFKAIKMPEGKASEYAKYSCNFYVGCSNECEYCYLKKGREKAILGGNIPTLKKCFKDENHALEVFEKELKANLPELQKHGLFFSFTTDPMLKGYTRNLTDIAVGICVKNKIPVKILTKRAEWVFDNSFPTHLSPGGDVYIDIFKKYVAFGFTLTGHDELEPNASTNAERIEAMRKLHDAGFKTFASIEPVIDFGSSSKMISATINFCDMYKIGLESGRKYNKKQIVSFVTWTSTKLYELNPKAKIYFKEGLLKQAGISRSELPSNCVGRDYNIFNN